MRVNGSKCGEINYIVPFSNGALTPVHVRKIGPAFPLFLLYEDRVTTGKGKAGIVLGGKPVTDEEAAEKLGLHPKTAARHRERLERHGYISTKTTGRGYSIRVRKSKKWILIQRGMDKSALSDGAEVSGQIEQKRSIRVDKNALSSGSVPINDQSRTNQGLSLVAEELVRFWNENKGGLPEIKTFTKTRKAKLTTRLKENPNFLVELKSALIKARASKFLLSWRPSVDWFLENDNNIVKVLEGKYENQGEKHGTPSASGNNSGTGKRAGPFIPEAIKKSIPATPNALTRTKHA